MITMTCILLEGPFTSSFHTLKLCVQINIHMCMGGESSTNQPYYRPCADRIAEPLKNSVEAVMPLKKIYCVR